MPSTYTPIQSYTVSGTSTSSINFNSVSGYTDLILVQQLPNDPTATYAYSNYRFNSDTGSNYSTTYMYWYNAVTSGRQSNASFILNGTSSYMGNTMIITHIQNYANSTTNKSVLTKAMFSANAGGSPQEIWASVGMWRSTSAITSVNVFINTGNYSSGSTFTLYGIKAA